MSAIWGMIDFNNNVVQKEILERMRCPLEKYKIDEYRYIANKNAGMGCALQFITEEAKAEKLPYEDENLFFTADVYLDNREELCEKLEIVQKERKSIPDGTLMIKAYKKWGEQFVAHLLGAFACAIYDKKEEKVLLVTDYTGNRCISFSYQDRKIVFSTLLDPIKVALGDNVQLNQRWLHDFTAISKLAISSECLETPYKDIYQVAPAQIVRIDKNGIQRIDYWNPANSRVKLKLESDEEYKKAFLALYEKVVAGSLRSCKETGVLLSGGLDSSSVACIAAKQLKEKGKKLKSFTSVPDKDYGGRRNPYLVADETKFVLGAALGVLLLQRETLVLHGSGVVVDNQAWIITGDSGAGKSTLTTRILKDKAIFLADDTVAIETAEQIYAMPGYPQQKLCKDAAVELGYDINQLRKINEEREKYAVALTDNFYNDKIELGLVCELIVYDGEEVQIEEMQGHEKLQAFLHNIYMGVTLKYSGMSPEFFTKCLQVVQKVPWYRIKRPKSGNTTTEQLKLLTQALHTKLYKEG